MSFDLILLMLIKTYIIIGFGLAIILRAGNVISWREFFLFILVWPFVLHDNAG